MNFKSSCQGVTLPHVTSTLIPLYSSIPNRNYIISIVVFIPFPLSLSSYILAHTYALSKRIYHICRLCRISRSPGVGSGVSLLCLCVVIRYTIVAFLPITVIFISAPRTFTQDRISLPVLLPYDIIPALHLLPCP